jgi:hypothetical protein
VKEQEMEIGIARKRKDKYALIDLYNYQHIFSMKEQGNDADWNINRARK